MIFKKLPKINVDGITLTDLSKRVSLLINSTSEDDFILYRMDSGETLQSLAQDFYGNPELDWLIASANGIVNPILDGLFDQYEVSEYSKVISNGNQFSAAYLNNNSNKVRLGETSYNGVNMSHFLHSDGVSRYYVSPEELPSDVGTNSMIFIQDGKQVDIDFSVNVVQTSSPILPTLHQIVFNSPPPKSLNSGYIFVASDGLLVGDRFTQGGEYFNVVAAKTVPLNKEFVYDGNNSFTLDYPAVYQTVVVNGQEIPNTASGNVVTIQPGLSIGDTVHITTYPTLYSVRPESNGVVSSGKISVYNPTTQSYISANIDYVVNTALDLQLVVLDDKTSIVDYFSMVDNENEKRRIIRILHPDKLASVISYIEAIKWQK